MIIGFGSMDWSRSATDERGRPTWGGAGWARCGMPAAYLEARGHEVYVGSPVFDPNRGLMGVRRWGADEPDAWPPILVLQRIMGENIQDHVAVARSNGQTIINDIDDWLFGVDRRNQASARMTPERLTSYRQTLERSDLVTCSTPYLAKRLNDMGIERTIVLRNSIDLARWDPATPSDDGIIRVGWVGAVPWRSGDVETLRPVFAQLIRRYGDRLRFAHRGAVPPQFGWPSFAELANIDPHLVDEHPMASITDLPRLYGGMDIGIVPLNDIEFNRAKSWIKGMEYAAAGIPFVAQQLPEYVALRDEFGIGRTARRTRDWLNRIDELMDPDERARERELVRLRVDRLDMASRVELWETAYEAAAT